MGLIKTTLTLGAGYALASKALNAVQKHDEAKARQQQNYSDPRSYDGQRQMGYGQQQQLGYGQQQTGYEGQRQLGYDAQPRLEYTQDQGGAPPRYTDAYAEKKGSHATWCNGACGGRCNGAGA